MGSNNMIETSQISPISQNSQNGTTPVYWSASQLLDNNNLVLQSRGVNATLDPISEEIDDMEDSNDSTSDRDTVNKTEDEDVYARGLANYGLQTQQQMRHLH